MCENLSRHPYIHFIIYIVTNSLDQWSDRDRDVAKQCVFLEKIYPRENLQSLYFEILKIYLNSCFSKRFVPNSWSFVEGGIFWFSCKFWQFSVIYNQYFASIIKSMISRESTFRDVQKFSEITKVSTQICLWYRVIQNLRPPQREGPGWLDAYLTRVA